MDKLFNTFSLDINFIISCKSYSKFLQYHDHLHILNWAICKYNLTFKVKHKTNTWFFGFFLCSIHPTSSYYSRNAINFFSFENGLFTLLTSSSSSIYKIVIAINIPTTKNSQFEALSAPKSIYTPSFSILMN